VIRDDREPDRHDHEEDDDRRDGANGRSSRVPTKPRLVEPPRTPQHRRPEHDEHAAGDGRGDRGGVVAGQAVDGDVADAVDRTGDDHQRPGRERGGCARSRSQPRVDHGKQRRACDGHQAARQVIARRGTRLAMPVRIVEHRQGRGDNRRHEIAAAARCLRDAVERRAPLVFAPAGADRADAFDLLALDIRVDGEERLGSGVVCGAARRGSRS